MKIRLQEYEEKEKMSDFYIFAQEMFKSLSASLFLLFWHKSFSHFALLVLYLAKRFVLMFAHTAVLVSLCVSNVFSVDFDVPPSIFFCVSFLSFA